MFFGGRVSVKVFIVFCRNHVHVQPKLRCRTKTAKLLDEPEIDELVAQAQIATAVAFADLAPLQMAIVFPNLPKLKRIFGYRYTVDTQLRAILGCQVKVVHDALGLMVQCAENRHQIEMNNAPNLPGVMVV